jgi:hypothetical protein
MSIQAVTGSHTATGSSASFAPESAQNRNSSAPFNFSLWGTFVGTVIVDRSFDGGTTWLPLTALGTSISFTAPCSEVFEEPEDGVIYRVRCSAYTSGTINYRLSQ